MTHASVDPNDPASTLAFRSPGTLGAIDDMILIDMPLDCPRPI